MTKNYKSNRKFKIWVYTVSHSTLIIRSEKQYPDVDYSLKYNNPGDTIDVEFSGVDFISIPQNFEELDIKKVGDKFIFNNNTNWFVQASSCIVGKSNWDFNEDRIMNMNLKYDEFIEL